MASVRLRIVSGKGGVGKTTVATALAEVRAGKQVLLAEVDGNDQVARLLGVPSVGPRMRRPAQPRSLTDPAVQRFRLLSAELAARAWCLAPIFAAPIFAPYPGKKYGYIETRQGVVGETWGIAARCSGSVPVPHVAGIDGGRNPNDSDRK